MPADLTPIFALPGPDLDDAANVEAAVLPLRDRLEEVLASIAAVPIGVPLPYCGSVLPAKVGPVEWAWADGDLIDRTTYGTFFARVGHAYNGGVDPGGNKVRLPDKRGRVSIGADSFGTARGAAGRIPNSLRARGQASGQERVKLEVNELAAHSHPDTIAYAPVGDHGHTMTDDGTHTHLIPYGALVTGANAYSQLLVYGVSQVVNGIQLDAPSIGKVTTVVDGGLHRHTVLGGGGHGHVKSGGVQGAGSGDPHLNMQPYEVDLYIVRIA